MEKRRHDEALLSRLKLVARCRSFGVVRGGAVMTPATFEGACSHISYSCSKGVYHSLSYRTLRATAEVYRYVTNR